MKWKAVDLQPGMIRTVTRFAWVPTRSGDTWYWLERYERTEVVRRLHSYYPDTGEHDYLVMWRPLKEGPR